MSFKEIRPEEAKRLMDESNYAYVDVRSEPEFLNGHPSGAVNIPVRVVAPINVKGSRVMLMVRALSPSPSVMSSRTFPPSTS